MLFSYGFIDPNAPYTSALTLDLTIPDDDPLGPAKEAASTAAAAVRISFDGRSTRWQSAFLWLVCVNEEDGLHFQVAQRQDGTRELSVSWQGQDISDDTDRLETLLSRHPRWEVYRLRAVSLLHDRVQAQMQRLGAAPRLPSPGHDDHEPRESDVIAAAVARLRHLEMGLLEACSRDLIVEVDQLSASNVVREYLSGGT